MAGRGLDNRRTQKQRTEMAGFGAVYYRARDLGRRGREAASREKAGEVARGQVVLDLCAVGECHRVFSWEWQGKGL